METKDAILRRKSVRCFSGTKLAREDLEKILFAGVQAPSGKNGQPWRFYVIQQDRKLFRQISGLTVYDSFVRTADCLILVFLDKNESYHYIKDCQGVGACIENMLLTVTDLGLGACWIGEILNRDLYVRGLLKLGKRYDLMAALAVGHPKGESEPAKKRDWKDCILSMR